MTNLLVKYRDGILATSLTGLLIPVVYNFNPRTLLASQIIGIGVQLGTQTWVSGVAGPSMRANLDKVTFSSIQSVLFPRYALFNSATSLLALVAFMKYSPGASLTQLWSPGLILVMSLVTNLANLLVFFPLTNTTMRARQEARKPSQPDEVLVKKAGMKFGMVHGTSMLLNFVTMAANLLFLYGCTSKLA